MKYSPRLASSPGPLSTWLVPALLGALLGGCGSDGGSPADAGGDASQLDGGSDRDGGNAGDAGTTVDVGSSTDASDLDAGVDAGPPELLTDPGAACATGSQCSRGVCLNLPGGYCSERCQSHWDCGEGGFCRSGYCYAQCASNDSCTREDYFCTSLDFFVDENNHFQYLRACYIGRTLGGTVTIADGVSLTVTDAVGGTLELTASGSFTFPNRVGFDSPYSVSFEVGGDVPGIHCAGTNLTGQVLGDVAAVTITCGREALFTLPGTHEWVVPDGVTSVSVVAVGAGGRGYANKGGGGGELCYQNDIAVTPGETIEVVVGNLHSEALGGQNSSFDGDLVAHGGSNAFNVPSVWEIPGGTGGTVGTCFDGGHGSANSSSGGAAGYAGVGGHAYMYPQMPAANGAGGGGGGGYFGTRGGGVGLEGMGADGVAPGGNGSQPSASVPVAGAGGTTYNNRPQDGMHGGVRIIWGAGRSYPSNASGL